MAKVTKLTAEEKGTRAKATELPKVTELEIGISPIKVDL